VALSLAIQGEPPTQKLIEHTTTN